MVTISDVAALAGVGLGTVSRVLNDSPRVRAETREKVLAAMATLDYRPSSLAQRLSRGRTLTIGVVVPFFTHASAVERLRGVVAALDGSRYDLVLFNVETPEHRDEHLAALTGRGRADGILVLSMRPPDAALDRLLATDTPIVMVDVHVDGVARVVTDDREGGRAATRHLLELGHERIAFIGQDPANPLGFSASTQRELAYEEVLGTHGIERDPALTRYGSHDRVVASVLADELLGADEPPTAVFASSDVQAIGVLDAARARGRTVPGDLAVVGYDDIELSTWADLTTVRQPLFDSGELGARLLLEALADGTPPQPVEHQLPVELVVRGTTAGPTALLARGGAGDDPATREAGMHP